MANQSFTFRFNPCFPQIPSENIDKAMSTSNQFDRSFSNVIIQKDDTETTVATSIKSILDTVYMKIKSHFAINKCPITMSRTQNIIRNTKHYILLRFDTTTMNSTQVCEQA
jgi:hypothetical protein